MEGAGGEIRKHRETIGGLTGQGKPEVVHRHGRIVQVVHGHGQGLRKCQPGAAKILGCYFNRITVLRLVIQNPRRDLQLIAVDNRKISLIIAAGDAELCRSRF